MTMVEVEIARPFRDYKEGQRASFVKSVADSLIQRGWARHASKAMSKPPRDKAIKKPKRSKSADSADK